MLIYLMRLLKDSIKVPASPAYANIILLPSHRRTFEEVMRMVGEILLWCPRWQVRVLVLDDGSMPQASMLENMEKRIQDVMVSDVVFPEEECEAWAEGRRMEQETIDIVAKAMDKRARDLERQEKKEDDRFEKQKARRPCLCVC